MADFTSTPFPGGTADCEIGLFTFRVNPGFALEAIESNLLPGRKTNMQPIDEKAGEAVETGDFPDNSEISPVQPFDEVNCESFLVSLRSEGNSRQKAFRRLVEVTHGPLMNYIRKFISSRDEGQEVLQEVYLGVHKSLGRFEGKSKLTTWIYGLAHNKICDRLGDKHRKMVALDDSHPEPETPPTLEFAEWSDSTPWDMSPDQVVLQSALRTLIARSVSVLPPAAFEVYFLRDVEGLSGEEVAEILGIAPGAVRVRLHRARQTLVEKVRGLMQGGSNGAEQGGKA